MKVRRVATEGGSHIEPPFDPSWSDLDKLRWTASVVEADTGVRPVPHLEENGLYSINVGASSFGGFTFGSAWTFLNGVSAGAAAAS